MLLCVSDVVVSVLCSFWWSVITLHYYLPTWVSSFNRKNKQILFFFTFRYWVWSGDLLLTSWSESPAESRDLMRGDALQAQCWPPSICAALCLMFNYYSMFSSLMTPLHPRRHVEIHTTLPNPKLSTTCSRTSIHLRALLFRLVLFVCRKEHLC